MSAFCAKMLVVKSLAVEKGTQESASSLKDMECASLVAIAATNSALVEFKEIMMESNKKLIESNRKLEKAIEALTVKVDKISEFLSSNRRNDHDKKENEQ